MAGLHSLHSQYFQKIETSIEAIKLFKQNASKTIGKKLKDVPDQNCALHSGSHKVTSPAHLEEKIFKMVQPSP